MDKQVTQSFRGRLNRTATLLEQLEKRIEQQIESGELPVGAQLPPEGALATRYGVSRPLVREALAQLRARGYLRTVNGRGTFVQHPDEVHLAEILLQQTRRSSTNALTPDDLYEARGAIELATVRLAAERAGAEAQLELAELLDRMRESAGDPAAYTAADVGFHVAIARASANPLLLTLLSPLVKLIVEGVFESHSTADATDAGIRAHTKILRAIERGDAAAAVRAMRAHLTESRGFFPDDVTAYATIEDDDRP